MQEFQGLFVYVVLQRELFGTASPIKKTLKEYYDSFKVFKFMHCVTHFLQLRYLALSLIFLGQLL
jgi:hypothetical protein